MQRPYLLLSAPEANYCPGPCGAGQDPRVLSPAAGAAPIGAGTAQLSLGPGGGLWSGQVKARPGVEER